MTQLVLGLDPSLTSTGACLVNPDGCYGNSWTFPSDRRLKGDSRLSALRHDLKTTLWACSLAGDKVMAAVSEDLPKAAQGAGLTARAQGVVRELLDSRGLPLATYAPASLKKAATGSGKATKEDMRQAVPQRFLHYLKNADEVDAFWAAQAGAYLLGWEHHLLEPTALDSKGERMRWEALESRLGKEVAA